MRVAVAAVVGYIVYFVWIAVTFSLLWLATGAAFAYEPGSTRVTFGWLAAATPINVIGAALAGWMALWIAKGNRKGVVALAVLMLLLGLTFAVINLSSDRSLPAGKTPATLSAQEAGQYSIQPTWYDFAIPLLAAAAVMVGGRKREEVGGPVSAAAPLA
jgi:hypothetical protein